LKSITASSTSAVVFELFFAAAAFAAASLVTAAAAFWLATTAGAATGPVAASATGAGQVHVGPEGEFLRTFSVSAREYADGTDKGQAQIQNRFGPFGPIHIEVDCLKVVGNTAFMSGFVKNITDPTLGIPEGSKTYFAVQDNGEGADSPPDLLSFVFFTGEQTGPTCEEILDTAFVFAVEDGNIQVRNG
jgi:hypothetical protein